MWLASVDVVRAFDMVADSWRCGCQCFPCGTNYCLGAVIVDLGVIVIFDVCGGFH